MRFNIVILVFMSFIIAMTPALDKKKKNLEDSLLYDLGKVCVLFDFIDYLHFHPFIINISGDSFSP